jgi:hypothetical protein
MQARRASGQEACAIIRPIPRAPPVAGATRPSCENRSVMVIRIFEVPRQAREGGERRRSRIQSNAPTG